MRTKMIAAAVTMASLFLLGTLPAQAQKQEGSKHVTTKAFGKLADGREAELYILTNKNGMEAAITNFGGTVVSLKVPDRNGKLDDVVLGYDTPQGYADGTFFFGSLIGRYGNRIAKAKFSLDGKEYTLLANDGPNTLHGGAVNYGKVLWAAEALETAEGPAVKLHYVSKDGEAGFPGDLSITVTYTLTNDNALKIQYHATTDKDTVVNLTNHSYFNLSGAGNGDILNHKVQIFASRFTPVDSNLIPTGELKAVAGTPFDFSKPTAVGDRINNEDEQLKLGHGYDHNFIVDEGGKGKIVPVAKVVDPASGRVLEVFSDEPAVQFYAGNFLDGTAKGKYGKSYARRTGLCLETQHYPDSPNQPKFPSTELKPGQSYKTTTIYKFGVE